MNDISFSWSQKAYPVTFHHFWWPEPLWLILVVFGENSDILESIEKSFLEVFLRSNTYHKPYLSRKAIPEIYIDFRRQEPRMQLFACPFPRFGPQAFFTPSGHHDSPHRKWLTNFLPGFATQKLSFWIIGVNRFGGTRSGKIDPLCTLPRIESPLQDFFWV